MVKKATKVKKTRKKIIAKKSIRTRIKNPSPILPLKKGENTNKPKMAIVSLTSCEGCQFVLLDLGKKFLDLVNQVEMVDFRLLEDEEDPGIDLDLVLVE